MENDVFRPENIVLLACPLPEDSDQFIVIRSAFREAQNCSRLETTLCFPE
jgi:hypothetical protein